PLGLSRGQENQKPDQDQTRKRGGLTADLISRMYSSFCRSEPAREKYPDNAFIQTGRVIVDVHRRNAARSMLAPTGSLEMKGTPYLIAFSNLYRRHFPIRQRRHCRGNPDEPSTSAPDCQPRSRPGRCRRL